MTRAVWFLGATQCVFWGVIYYGFAVWLLPLERELDATRAQVAGAYSLGLLMMALVAPAIGRRIDADRGIAVMRYGLALAIAGLGGLAATNSLPMLYLVWAVLGVAMGMILYEPAFGLVNRAVHDDGERLRALSAVTVVGGLASTLFLPALALLTENFGWREAVLGGAFAVLAGGLVLERRVFPAILAAPPRPPPVRASTTLARRPKGFIVLSILFVSGTMTGMALTVLLVPLLIERGTPAPLAASALAALGLSQLPGRIWLLRGRRELPIAWLTTAPMALQAAGLGIVALASQAMWSAAGVVVFGAGAGLQTLMRPWLVQKLFGAATAGALNGHVARSQGLARAFAPLLAAAAALTFGSASVFLAMAVWLALLIPLARMLAVERPQPVSETNG